MAQRSPSPNLDRMLVVDLEVAKSYVPYISLTPAVPTAWLACPYTIDHVVADMIVLNPLIMESRAPRLGHKKSRNGCAQCKRRHVKCNEDKPCANCVRHGVACSLAGGPNVPRDDAKPRRSPGSPSTGRQDSTTDSETTGTPKPRGYSPLRNLTRSLDRGGSGVLDQGWMTDLQLMHHFDNHTDDIMTETGIFARIWQQELPRLAFASPYLMHIVLGLSALHKAYYLPSRQARLLQTSAVGHLDQALTLYRQDSAIPTAENAEARFSFSCLITIFAYAVRSSTAPIDAMCEHFRLVQGIDATVTESFMWIVAGPFAPMLNRSLHEAMRTGPDNGTVLPEGMELGLNHLDYMLGAHTMDIDERQTCTYVLNELKQLYANIVEAQSATGFGLVICWPKHNLTHYSDLLRRRVPQALVILGYYAVVVDLMDDRWWLQGWGSQVLQNVLGELNEEWKSWVDWPARTVLMNSNRQRQRPQVPIPLPLPPGGSDMLL